MASLDAFSPAALAQFPDDSDYEFSGDYPSQLLCSAIIIKTYLESYFYYRS